MLTMVSTSTSSQKYLEALLVDAPSKSVAEESAVVAFVPCDATHET